MKKNNSPSLRNDNKRLQRNVADFYLKLEKLIENSKRVKDLFRPKANQVRQKVKLQCEQLLLDDSLKFGKKALELLWKNCYHSYMQFYKKHKKLIKNDEYNLLVSYFLSGTGYFYSLLLKFSSDYGDRLSEIVPELFIEKEFDLELKKKKDLVVVSIGNQCIHRILICLGDLYRYLDNLGKDDCRILATKWYNAAIMFDSSLGMPFNQLGSLAGTDNYNIDSVYFYIRSITCEKPFDNAEENLKFIFNLNKNLSSEINSSSSENVNLVKNCLIEFINLTSLFWFETNSLAHLEFCIGNTLNAFSQAVLLKPKQTNPRKPTYLSPETVFQLTVIIIILNQKTKNHSLNSATIAFATNFLFYLINTVLKEIKEKNIVDKFVICKENKPNGFKEIKYNEKSLFKLRRKANFKNINIEEDSLLNVQDEEDDLNELEETALSTIDALEMSSDMSETGSFCDEEEEDESSSLSSDEYNSSQNHSGSNSSHINTTTIEIGKFLSYLYNESVLPSIKIILDWLIINKEIFETYYEAFGSLINTFVELLNLLLELEEKAIKSNNNLSKFKYEENWTQKYPLTIDISVSNIDMFKKYQKKNLNFKSYLNYDLSEEENGFLCLQNIISFGHHLSNNLTRKKIDYSSSLNKFNLLENESTEKKLEKTSFLSSYNLFNTSPFEKTEKDDDLTTNGFDFGSPTFMKNNFLLTNNYTDQMDSNIIPNMSHLWLDNDKLSKAYHENGHDKNITNENTKKNFLPYILIDTTGYSDYLNLVKELFFSKNFIIVVPKKVIRELGRKQKNSFSSKEAIKWIKIESQKSKKFIKLLKSNERLKVSNIFYPNKEEKTSYDFHILLEHCNYLNKKNIPKYNLNGMKKEKIILLFGRNNCFPVNYEELLDKIGVKSEELENFVVNWRTSNKAKT